MKSNLIQRILTGIVFVAAMVGCILGGAISFGILFLLITLFAIHEFCKLVNKYEQNVQVNTGLCMLGGAVMFLCFFLNEITPFVNGIFIPYLIILIGIMVSELYAKKNNPINNWAYSFLSQVYIALPFSLMNVLAFHSEDPTSVSVYYYIFPLALCLLVWTNDIGAYVVGCTIGKHRLFPRISPKKSWEGSIGGAVFCVVVSTIIAHFYPVLSTIEWAGFALVVVTFGTWGDLTESLMKRHWGIKDSGNILPGHGGILDRFDSTLLAVPATLLYLFAVTF
ncbi:MAG: phosphatidate cytidylyltransferase [Phocaeicola sp.]|uniref:phosphatidate cytidylyltransferase n=1 Tax=Phocaeicola sp. TaxID=2773926 RepID=UPI003F9F7556